MTDQTQATQEASGVRPWSRMVDALPPLSSVEKEKLELSIKRYGIKHRIFVRQNDEIIDGYHRKEIADKLGIECPKETLDLSEEEAFALGISLNLDRRQLTYEQINDIHETLKPVVFKWREQGKSEQEIADITGIPQQTVSFWLNNNAHITNVGNRRNVELDCRTKVSKQGKEKIVERYKKGETQKQIAADYKLSHQHVSRIVKQAERTQKKISDIIENLKTTAQIRPQNAVDFIESFSDKSVDLLLTDPPYSTEIKNLTEFIDSWLFKALAKLKDSGQAYIFIGSYAWEIRDYLNALAKVEKRFGEPQILVWTYKNTIGPNPLKQYIQNWQTILYLRGPDAYDLVEDKLINKLCVQEFNAPDGRNGTRYSRWEKPIELAKRLIQHSVTTSSVVIDPFAGTGTFLLAAAELGYTNYGSENNPEMIEIAKTRGCIIG